MNKNGVATISHNEYKNVLLINKFIRHLNFENIKHKTNKVLLSYFDGKIYVKNNGRDILALGY